MSNLGRFLDGFREVTLEGFLEACRLYRGDATNVVTVVCLPLIAKHETEPLLLLNWLNANALAIHQTNFDLVYDESRPQKTRGELRERYGSVMVNGNKATLFDIQFTRSTYLASATDDAVMLCLWEWLDANPKYDEPDAQPFLLVANSKLGGVLGLKVGQCLKCLLDSFEINKPIKANPVERPTSKPRLGYE